MGEEGGSLVSSQRHTGLEASLDCMRHHLRINQQILIKMKNKGKKKKMVPKLKNEWISYVIILTIKLISFP